ncbi:hypothetical protein [Streptomyces sp. NPDC048644]|uniref:hypothetical protein n=1 Tax=Streptomyces sp. NPDC048644 TaxID=3365582 RepID=UPI003718952A
MSTEHPKGGRASDEPPDWTEVSSLTGMAPEELQDRYTEVLKSENLTPTVENISAASDAPGYDLTVVPGVLSVAVAAELEGGDNWKAKLTFTPKVFGHGLETSGFYLSSVNSHITIHPGMAVAKADLTIGFSGPKLSFGVTGNACYFGHEGDSPFSGWGWICSDVNATNLFSLRS